MKFGAKTFDDVEMLRATNSVADFFEIQAIQTVDYSFLEEFDKPIIIHAEHTRWGVNSPDKTAEEHNRKSIEYAIKLAKKTNAKKIIAHPGHLIDENCSKEQAIKFLKSVKDDRILIENMPLHEDTGLAATPEEMKEFMKKTNKRFILDLNHAYATSLHLNKEPIEFLKKFIELEPSHYHLGGQHIQGENYKEHLNFRQSNIPVKEILYLLPKDAEITLEVTADIEETLKDFEYIKSLIK